MKHHNIPVSKGQAKKCDTKNYKADTYMCPVQTYCLFYLFEFMIVIIVVNKKIHYRKEISIPHCHA